ncbi:MAG TPA: gluconokinase [Sphingomonas sp.]|nr:gluconokinase [Sphingomonas sp.]
MIAGQPSAIVVMGVSGSGKSTLGGMLAAELRCPFLEGDNFHPDANVAKMRSGEPLDDGDRWPWLDALGAAAGEAAAKRGRVVVACSALKHSYRDRLAAAIGAPALFVLLEATAEELERRMGNRPGHYMPKSLLDSQLQALERPGSDEYALALDADTPIRRLCDDIHAFLDRVSTKAHRTS